MNAPFFLVSVVVFYSIDVLAAAAADHDHIHSCYGDGPGTAPTYA